MAELLGVFISSIDEAIHEAFPMFHPVDAEKYVDYGPIDPEGSFAGVFLGRNVLIKDEKRLRLRPTGEADSGPYFNSVLSGYYGVDSASDVAPWTPNGRYDTVRAITTCNFSLDKRVYLDYQHQYARYISRLYCDGKTVVAYAAYCTESSSYWESANFFVAYSVAANHTFQFEKRINFDKWSYQLPYRVNWDNADRAKQDLDIMLWDVLSGAASGHVDPRATHTTLRQYVVGGARRSLVKGDLQFDRGELTAFQWWDLTRVLEGKYRALAGEAYYNAAQNLPKSASNTIANVLEGASTIVDLLHGDISKLIPSNPKDAWLFYRYQYSTTKLDITDYKELTERLCQLASLPILRSDGAASSSGITCHCEISVDPAFLIPDDTKAWLRTYGFKLSAYNVWDMIPYSFVVDWFFHIGNFLEILEGENWAYSLPILDSWTSFTTFGPGAQRTYFRVPGYYRAACPFLDYTQRSASGKTIIKRILDSIALFG